jgi:predicted ATP-binding protein involved in virulence
MKIRNFACSKVHGYLNFSLTFRPDLTFLTGINGAGKTSAVRAITSLLAPSITDLANMIYESLSVTIEHEDREITVNSRRSEDQISISCTGVTKPLTIPLLKSQAYEPRYRFAEKERDFYREQEAVNARHPVLIAIEQLPTPMFLDLERRRQAGTRQGREGWRESGRIAPANPLAGSLLDSLKDAEELAESTFRRFLTVRTRYADELKQEIILSAFAVNTTDEGESAAPVQTRSLIKQIEKNERVVHNSLSQIGISAERISQTVRPFFELVRDVASRRPSQKRLSAGLDQTLFKDMQDWSAVQPTLRQINRFAGLITEYDARVRAAFEPLDRYLKSVNGFLADSSKTLSFDPSANLRVAIGEETGDRSITSLSSGERQLVVILTHLAFNPQAKRANVLIIDEPELSLHLRWQELFVDAVTTASPGVQVILATHSPSIIKGRIESCVDVEEARHSDRLFA